MMKITGFSLSLTIQLHQLKTLIEYTLKQLILLFFSSKDMSCLFTEPLFSLHRSLPDIILCGVPT